MNECDTVTAALPYYLVISFVCRTIETAFATSYTEALAGVPTARLECFGFGKLQLFRN